jgi:hypothetical protein
LLLLLELDRALGGASVSRSLQGLLQCWDSGLDETLSFSVGNQKEQQYLFAQYMNTTIIRVSRKKNFFREIQRMKRNEGNEGKAGCV